MKRITVIGETENYDQGKSGWIMDPGGNEIELWEPVNKTFMKTNGLDG